MEISFDSRNADIYRELYVQTKQVQEIAESVVPDTNDDISKIAVVQSSVLLKSKDITARGVLVTGEANASLMYITEAQDKVSYVRLSKSFSIEYDIPDIDSEAVAQVEIAVVSAEARVINPRKVSVCFEISGEMSCYVRDSLGIESGLPSNNSYALHTKYEESEVNIVNSVCEKTFSLSEQFSFPNGKPKPYRLVSGNIDFMINDTQLVGTKVIVKGNADISICYLSEEVNYPVKAEFSTAFSQLVDIGDEEMDSCNITASLTGLYFELTDSISGDKMLDFEAHAVLQLVCRRNRSLVYISDAYSNLMESECCRQQNLIKVVSESKKIKISADERISIMDDCADILSIFVSLSRIVCENGYLKATVFIDAVYRNNGGQLSSARRNMTLETQCTSQEFRIKSPKLTDVYLRPDGQYLDAHLSLELVSLNYTSVEIDKVVSVVLDEDKPAQLDKYPALTLVRCTGESLWDLAKTYHSSTERIAAVNDIDTELYGRMILIPKGI